MKLISSNAVIADIGEVKFCPRSDWDDPATAFELSDNGQTVGELAPLQLPGEGRIELDAQSGANLGASGSWSLNIASSDVQPAGWWILYVAPQDAGYEPVLTPDLAAWATLTLACSRAVDRLPRG